MQTTKLVIGASLLIALVVPMASAESTSYPDQVNKCKATNDPTVGLGAIDFASCVVVGDQDLQNCALVPSVTGARVGDCLQD